MYRTTKQKALKRGSLSAVAVIGALATGVGIAGASTHSTATAHASAGVTSPRELTTMVLPLTETTLPATCGNSMSMLAAVGIGQPVVGYGSFEGPLPSGGPQPTGPDGGGPRNGEGW